MPLFPPEIGPARPLSFKALYERMLERVRGRVREGAITERGLARATGLSQPHIHHLLKSARMPTTASADAILAILFHGGVADLLGGDDFEGEWRTPEPSAGVRLLRGVVSQRVAWMDGWSDDEPVPFPCSVIAELREPAALRVVDDAQMGLGAGVVAADLQWQTGSFPDPRYAYVVIVDGCGAIRWIRPGRACLYLATDATLDRPARWVQVKKSVKVTARIPRNLNC
jgi:hypothetical protein